MRREHCVQLRLRPMVAEGLEPAIVGTQRIEPRLRAFGIDQRRQPVRARIERALLQLVHQRRDVLQRQLTALQFARQVVRQLEHRVEQRRLARAFVQIAQPPGKRGKSRLVGRRHLVALLSIPRPWPT